MTVYPSENNHIHFCAFFWDHFHRVYFNSLSNPYEIAKASILNAILQMLTLEDLYLILRPGCFPGHWLLEVEELLCLPNNILLCTWF